ncbi:MAG TPA: hypothetical protein VIP98_24345 [Microlunatus sp.]
MSVNSFTARRLTTASVPEVVRAALRRVAHLGRTNAVELRAIIQIVHDLRRADGTPRLDLSSYEETHQGQQALFRRGRWAGELRDFDSLVMAVTYQGAIDTMISYLESHPDADPEQYADALADLLIAAIRA